MKRFDAWGKTKKKKNPEMKRRWQTRAIIEKKTPETYPREPGKGKARRA